MSPGDKKQRIPQPPPHHRFPLRPPPLHTNLPPPPCPELCKYFLCGFCPNDLFLNTRVSLGHCDQKHDEGLAEMWNTLAEKERRSFGFVELVSVSHPLIQSEWELQKTLPL